MPSEVEQLKKEIADLQAMLNTAQIRKEKWKQRAEKLISYHSQHRFQLMSDVSYLVYTPRLDHKEAANAKRRIDEFYNGYDSVLKEVTK